MEAKFNLILHTEPEIGKLFPLAPGSYPIGRDPENLIIINHPEVSRKHAILSYENDTFLIEDLGSLNGTYIDGEQIVGTQFIEPGAIVGFGGIVTASIQPAPVETLLPPMLDDVPDDGVPPEEPIEEIPDHDGSEPQWFQGAEPAYEPNTGSSKWQEVRKIALIVLIVVAICAMIGLILFIWFIDSYSLWCQVLPFLFPKGVCP